ncbi:MAG: hypothetical protein AAF702_08750 [Chloroflexota bacterium]
MTTHNRTPDARIQTRRKALLDAGSFPMAAKFPRKETIENLSKCLMAFGNRLFDFFQLGFDGTAKGYRLEPSVAYPKEYVLNTILTQISHDVGALQKAYQQRSVPELASRLKTADNLAYLSLLPAIEQGILPVSTTITYFHKSPNVRVVPYAPIALVGIPFSARDPHNNFDLLATPHEVGHYVYRHGWLPNAPEQRLRTAFEHKIKRSFPVEERWVLQWLEEIFADTYGCLVATEAMTESFRDILLSHSGKQFSGDTGKHPIPAVRMYVYTTALERYGYTEVAEQFMLEWERILDFRGRPSEFTLGESYANVSFKAAQETFKKTVDCFAELAVLDSLKSTPRPVSYPLWGTVNSQSFDHFVERYGSDDAPIEIPELKIRDNKIYVDRPGEYDRSNRMLGDTNTWLDIINRDAQLNAPIPPVAWSAIFDSLDWTDEGPHSRD